jgi:hypothetical protein
MPIKLSRMKKLITMAKLEGGKVFLDSLTDDAMASAGLDCSAFSCQQKGIYRIQMVKRPRIPALAIAFVMPSCFIFL